MTRFKKGELEAVALVTLVRSGGWMTVDEICDEAGIPLKEMDRSLGRAMTRPVFKASPEMACAGLPIEACSRLDELGIVFRKRKGADGEIEFKYSRKPWGIA